jgi:hypothetical protein
VLRSTVANEHRERFHKLSFGSEIMSDGPLGQAKIEIALDFVRLKQQDLPSAKESASLGKSGAGGNNRRPEIGEDTTIDENAVAFVFVNESPGPLKTCRQQPLVSEGSFGALPEHDAKACFEGVRFDYSQPVECVRNLSRKG